MSESVLMNKGGKDDLVYERVFDAPKELVWNAWSVPELIMKWWGPMGYTSPSAKTDFRVGGKYLWGMQGPPGTAWNTGVYKEIVPMERIVFTQAFADEKGNIVSARKYGLPGEWPADVLITVTLEEQGRKTKLTLRESGIPNEMKQMAGAGMNQSLDKLGQSLATMPRKGELFIERIFDAPRELVWQMWTVPQQMMRWWGPEGYTAPTIKIDFRVGGKYLSDMRSPEGIDVWSTGTYKEIKYLEKIVATDSFADEDGDVVEPMFYGEQFADLVTETNVVFIFEDLGARTKMTLRQSDMPQGEMLEQSMQGWNQSFDKLEKAMDEDLLKSAIIAEPGKQEITTMDVYDAPRELVFKAYTDPLLIPQFWGPERFTTVIEKYEPRKGGIWRFVQKDKDGNVFAFNGVIHEIKAPERIVQTFEFEGMAGHVLFETAWFLELKNKTLVISKSVFQSVADRDGMLNSGAGEGATESNRRLNLLLKKLK